MDGEPRLRIFRVSEDADEDGTLVVPDCNDYVDPGEAPPDEPHEAEHKPGWVCEHCGQPNESWRDPCAMCGRAKEDAET